MSEIYKCLGKYTVLAGFIEAVIVSSSSSK